MTQILKIKCPYCNFVIDTSITITDNRSRLVFCDSEDGGCDREFVVKPTWTIQCQTQTSKLPWENIERE